eukprot:5807596-Pyramimonas_sp.AAC.1
MLGHVGLSSAIMEAVFSSLGPCWSHLGRSDRSRTALSRSSLKLVGGPNQMLRPRRSKRPTLMRRIKHSAGSGKEPRERR